MAYNSDKALDRTKFGAENIEEKKSAASNSQAGLLIQRRSMLKGTCAFLQYIGSLPRKEYRKGDKVSDLLVLVCLLFAVMLITLPSALVRPPVVALADLVFLAVIVFFIMSRMGILITLSERQAILVWDIIVGALLLGMLLSFNAMYFIACLHR